MSTIDYSGVSSLAQAVLAVNLAYIGLERFRYRKVVERMHSDMCDQFKDASSQIKEDLAWKNLTEIPSGASKKAWGSRFVSFYMYKYLFMSTLDIYICLAFAALSTILLAVHAYDALIADANMTGALAWLIWLSDVAVNWLIFLFLLLGIILPVVFIFLGRRATASAKASMEENLEHLGSRMKAEAEAALNATRGDLATLPQRPASN